MFREPFCLFSIHKGFSLMTRSLTRRHFLATGAALLATPALATKMPAGWVLPEAYMPRVVALTNGFAENEIHVDPASFALYYTLPDGEAIRYSVGIAKGDLYIPGRFHHRGQEGVAELDADERDDRAQPDPLRPVRRRDAGRADQPARGARALPFRAGDR